MSYSSSGGGLNLIRRLFQTVSELKRYICSQYVEMEHTLAEKRRNLLRYTPKPHSHALNDVIMHKTHLCELRQIHATEFASEGSLTVGIVFIRVTCKLFEFIGFLYFGHVTFQIWS